MNDKKVIFLNANSYFYNISQNQIHDINYDKLKYMLNSLDENIAKQQTLVINESSRFSHKLCKKINKEYQGLPTKEFPLKISLETFITKVSTVVTNTFIIVDNLSKGYPIEKGHIPKYKNINIRELWRLRTENKIPPMYTVGRNKFVELNFKGYEELADLMFHPTVEMEDSDNPDNSINIPEFKNREFPLWRG